MQVGSSPVAASSHERARRHARKPRRIECWEVARHFDAIAAAVEEGWPELVPWLESDLLVDIPFMQLIGQDRLLSSPWRDRAGFFCVWELIHSQTLAQHANRSVEDGWLRAELDDYRVVYELLTYALDPGRDAPLPREMRAVFELVGELWERSGRPVRESALVRESGLPESAVRRLVEEAISLGLLRDLAKRKERPSRLLPAYCLPPAGMWVLPTPEEIEKALQPRRPRKKKR